MSTEGTMTTIPQNSSREDTERFSIIIIIYKKNTLYNKHNKKCTKCGERHATERTWEGVGLELIPDGRVKCYACVQ